MEKVETEVSPVHSYIYCDLTSLLILFSKNQTCMYSTIFYFDQVHSFLTGQQNQLLPSMFLNVEEPLEPWTLMCHHCPPAFQFCSLLSLHKTRSQDKAYLER